jgi:hypothetical protein
MRRNRRSGGVGAAGRNLEPAGGRIFQHFQVDVQPQDGLSLLPQQSGLSARSAAEVEQWIKVVPEDDITNGPAHSPKQDFKEFRIEHPRKIEAGSCHDQEAKLARRRA